MVRAGAFSLGIEQFALTATMGGSLGRGLGVRAVCFHGRPWGYPVTNEFGVVVVGFESGDQWGEFLVAWEQSSMKPRQIVVVDNSPTPDLPGKNQTTIPTRGVSNSSNEGYGQAVNRGVALLESRHSWVIVCNPDVRVQADTVEKLLAHSNDFDKTAVIGPRIINARGETYPSARAIPGIRVGIGHALFSNLWPTNPWTERYLGIYRGNESRSVGWLSGSFLLIRRDVFDSLGGFDPAYFMFFEDVDLGRRVKSSGHRNIYAPDAAITHLGATSTSRHEKAMLLAHHESARRFLNTLYSKWYHGPLRGLLTLGLRLRARFQTRNLP